MKTKLKKYKSIFGNQIPTWNGKKISKRYIWSHFGEKQSVNMFSKLENRYFHHNAVAVYEKNFLKSNKFDEHLTSKEDRYWANKIILKKHKILYDPNLIVDHHYTENVIPGKVLADLMKINKVNVFHLSSKFASKNSFGHHLTKTVNNN